MSTEKSETGADRNKLIGTVPCSECGSGNIKVQTPLKDNGMIDEAYIKCFHCGNESAPVIYDEEMTFIESTTLDLAPIINKWESNDNGQG